MKTIKIAPAKGLRGVVRVPGDKSISHRAAILSAIACGKTTIKNFLFSDDCLATLGALSALGVRISADKKAAKVVIASSGGFKKPRSLLFMKESGTSARVLLGLLSGQDFSTELTAAPSLLRRPMQRVIEPLALMGARIKASGKSKEGFLPLQVLPSRLHGIHWRQKIASAQVKSAILLAGLYAEGRTVVEEPQKTRDHTERMLKIFGADIKIKGGKITLTAGVLRSPRNIFVPGDISSAVFFIVAALAVKNSRILIKDVGINPSRMGAVRVLKRMGGRIKILRKRSIFEPIADIEVQTSALKATTIKAHEIPCLIDELPILMVAAGIARGRSVIEGVQELRVKETDRIASMVSNLTKLGVNIKVRLLNKGESIEITGGDGLSGADLLSFCDHRTAMSMVVAGLAAKGRSSLDDISCVTKSFPDFLGVLKHLLVK
ncbi:MAG TPA: 3-phosphoshikimate 1-carboxyvinyltransferase [Candidatus Omnitrophica bacterium]|nr:3-phosphoshikimate 1-carboxyvinyltransferase [Candidatus Omnitrophota bacterium]